jgi:hypothetical protein
MIRFHPSSVASLMGDAKSIDPGLLANPDLLAISKKKVKTDDDKAILAPLWDQTLSAGAKTYLKKIASQFLFDYHPVITTKEMAKGNQCEQASIDLYNAVFFTRHTKNTERRTNDYLTGECDIYEPKKRTKDIKSSWSLETFPILSEDCHDTTYFWQGVSYGVLWPDVEGHEVAHCMVPTPEELLRYESPDVHQVAHIDPAKRVTRIYYPRDPVAEKLLETKCKVAQQYLAQIVARFNAEHNITPDWKKQFLTT